MSHMPHSIARERAASVVGGKLYPRQHKMEMYKKMMTAVHTHSDATSRSESAAGIRPAPTAAYCDVALRQHLICKYVPDYYKEH